MTDETALVEADQIRVPARATSIDMHIDAASVSLIPTNLGEVVAFAQLMSRAGVAVPKHLREQPGACLAVSMQAFHWGMEPFAVANKSYSVNDRMAYEAQLIAAVVIKLVPHVGYPRYSYAGEGDKRRCTVEITTDEGEVVPLESPEFGKIQPKNSPLWKTDPDQQQGYYTIRAWARRHRPDVLLGVYDREEAATFRREDEDAPATSFEALEQRGAAAETVTVVDPPARNERKSASTKDTPEKAPGAPSAEDKSSQSGAPQGNQTQPAQVAGEPADPGAHAETAKGAEPGTQGSAPEGGTAGPQGASAAPAAETGNTTAASATDASGASAAGTSGQQQPADKSTDGEKAADAPKAAAEARAAKDQTRAVPAPKPDTLSPGFPLQGESYIIADEALNAHKARNLYKDGQAIKSIHPSAVTAYSAYAAHAVQEASQEGGEGEKSPTGSDVSQDQAEAEHPIDGFGDFADAVADADDLPTVDHAFAALMQTEAWKQNVPARDVARRVAYARLTELGIEIDLKSNLRLWRFYLEWETDLARLMERYAVTHSMANPAWAALAPQARDALDRAADNAKGRLRALAQTSQLTDAEFE